MFQFFSKQSTHVLDTDDSTNLGIFYIVFFLCIFLTFQTITDDSNLFEDVSRTFNPDPSSPTSTTSVHNAKIEKHYNTTYCKNECLRNLTLEQYRTAHI
jgi:hypothetical protein